ncbi:MAG: fibronectin type III domain-containing protein [Candidatus Tectomicrobia bacterium]|nr:fibronectin type III domain-containing protein [Candidatus Tectomicrobia bacterium]
MAQTVTATISPSGEYNITEGETVAITVTLANVPQDATANFGILEIRGLSDKDTDIKIYNSDPSMGTATALTLADPFVGITEGNYVLPWSAPGDHSGTFNYWIQIPEDQIYFEEEQSFDVAFRIFQADPYPLLIQTPTLTLKVAEAPLVATDKPSAPANLAATAGQGAVTLTWDAIDGDPSTNVNLENDLTVTKHQFRQTTDNDITDDTWTDIPDSGLDGINATSYTVTNLTDGTTYTFQVRAVNGCATTAGCGNSDPATAVMATPDAGARTPPTGLTATAGNREVSLNWTDPDDATITFYEYQQKVDRAGFGPWTPIPGSGATTTSYRLTGLDNGTTYLYRIRVGRGPDISLASDTVTATPRGAPPAAPVLTVTPRTGSVTLSWPNPDDPNILRWEYQYRVGAGVYKPWQTARATDASRCSASSTSGVCGPPYFTLTNATLQSVVDGLTNGTEHTFRLRAVNADGETISNEVSVAPVAGVPAKPTGLRSWVDQVPWDHRFVEWDRVEDASILRFEFTVDEGRTWQLLLEAPFGHPAGGLHETHLVQLEREEYLSSEYVFRIRAVNALGPGPASERALGEEETGPRARATAIRASNVRVQYDANTSVATLVWDPTERDDVRVWSVYFRSSSHRDWDTVLPVGTTSYAIPDTVSANDDIEVLVVGCLISLDCGRGGFYTGYFELFGPVVPKAPSGFSATPGDAQIVLAWDAPTDTSITHFEYEMDMPRYGLASNENTVPDSDNDGSMADETSYTVTTIDNVFRVTSGSPLLNGDIYHFRLRAVNADGDGGWTKQIRDVMPLAAGVPAAPSGFVRLYGGDANSY